MSISSSSSLGDNSSHAAGADVISVMLVDDSAIVRGFLTRILQSDPDIAVVATTHNGEAAVQKVENVKPDILILDVEMPIMDGITALPLLLEKSPDTKILMCSTLTQRNAGISLKALSLGAVDCIGKPSTTSELSNREEFGQELLYKVKNIARPRFTRTSLASSVVKSQRNVTPKDEELPKKKHLYGDGQYQLVDPKTLYNGKPPLLAIGSSTGGPRALFDTLVHLSGLSIPIVITQHMPATFTRILAQHINEKSGIPCHEAENGMEILPGQAYVAAGGYHMLLKQKGGKIVLELDDSQPVNFCKPAVDPMLESIMKIYGNKFLALILTGMGQDGLEGCRALKEQGGRVVAQDEESSTVWGMPGAVAMNNLCMSVLPLSQIGQKVRQIITS